VKKKYGFTLIELLIVVAIIAILAAIAVPNFLEAQVRAKVSRAKSDLRTYATAIESYAVDNNKPPREYDASPAKDGPFFGQTNASGIMAPILSTPISYISNAYGLDPFVKQGDNIPEDEKYFTYQDIRERRIDNPASAFWPAAEIYYGYWRMCSIGPDRKFTGGGFTNSAQLPYDPTNGTISPGNIWRSPRGGDIGEPPVGPLIGPH